MKKTIFLITIGMVLLSVFFIPVTQQKNLLIKSSFLNVYNQVANPLNWKKWRIDLRKTYNSDSLKIAVKTDTGWFAITNGRLRLTVKPAGSIFNIRELLGDDSIKYSYSIIPGKLLNQTWVIVTRKTNLLGYLVDGFGSISFLDTHVSDLKKFMETDSLIYGSEIVKIKVPESNLIVIKKSVIAKNKFTEAAGMFAKLQQYVAARGLKQTQPVIAQFLPKGADSAQVNIGFFINREVASDRVVIFTRMPKGGPLYTAKFVGKFDERGKAYAGLQHYFADHSYQTAILPFETYLDNKLPTSDTATVKIQVNFTAYF